jgi:predicted amidophosphoribosyltransferase
MTQLMTQVKNRLKQYPVQMIQCSWGSEWTIIIHRPHVFPLNVLLIDDSVHSWDTLNHVAFHISKRGVQHIDALCLVGENKI